MTKPGFIRKRLILLFESNDILEKQKIVNLYNKLRKSRCYCGHTNTCDCANPGISEFENGLKTNSITEKELELLFEV